MEIPFFFRHLPLRCEAVVHDGGEVVRLAAGVRVPAAPAVGEVRSCNQSSVSKMFFQK